MSRARIHWRYVATRICHEQCSKKMQLVVATYYVWPQSYGYQQRYVYSYYPEQLHAHMQIVYVRTCVRIYTYIYVYIYIYIYTYVSIRTYVRIYIYVRTYVLIRTYIYIYIYIRICTYIYVRTYVRTQFAYARVIVPDSNYIRTFVDSHTTAAKHNMWRLRAAFSSSTAHDKF